MLTANAGDRSLFQQPDHQVRRTIDDFLLAEGEEGRIIGCAALHWHRPANAEILAVAVEPELQGKGVGSALLRACIEHAAGKAAEFLWLATAKPGYFARFGFQPISRWRLPLVVLLTKLRLIFQQPPARWLPAIFGRHTFMRYARGAAPKPGPA
ncbi:MAG TPA: GNAT family N-acetyltransferase [Polyangiaceae bacterium]|jgi:N-acetylglutamate synthase-like GNAT family acetyltransferase